MKLIFSKRVVMSRNFNNYWKRSFENSKIFLSKKSFSSQQTQSFYEKSFEDKRDEFIPSYLYCCAFVGQHSIAVGLFRFHNMLMFEFVNFVCT
jgi:hypothetical protein